MCEAVIDHKYKPEGSEFATSETRIMVYNAEAYKDVTPPPDEDPDAVFETEDARKKAREDYFKRLNSIKRIRTFAVKCFKPAVCFNQIMRQEVRSLILISGTLSPMDMYEDDLGMDFDIKLQNSHVIEPEQAMLRIVKSYQGQPFVFDYRSRNNKDMLLNLGRFVQDISSNL